MFLRILLIVMVVYMAVNLVRRAIGSASRFASPGSENANRRRTRPDLDRTNVQDAEFKDVDGGPHAN